MNTLQIKRASTSAIILATPLAYGELAYAKDTNKIYVGTDGTPAGIKILNPDVGEVEEAAKLAVAQNFSIGGEGSDATAEAVAFDGTQAVQLVLKLVETGVTAGTYPKVAVDAKGRVIQGFDLTVADLPDIPLSKISDAGTAAGKNVGTAAGEVPEIGEDGKLPVEVVPDMSDTYVPTTRTVNGQALSDNITLTPEDVQAVPSSEKGVAGGVATLDENGLVPSSQLPSYVDDVVEVATYDDLPETGEAGKIYITTDDNKTYRWGGTVYVEISSSLVLGTTSSTAFRGDYGNTIYQATVNGKLVRDNPALTAEDVGADPAGTAAEEAAKKVASVTAGDNSVVIGGTTVAPTVAVQVSSEAGQAIVVKSDGLYCEGKVYTAGNGIEISAGDVISAQVAEGNGLSVSSEGIAMAVATASTPGAVKGDNTSITNNAGTLSVGDIDCGELT